MLVSGFVDSKQNAVNGLENVINTGKNLRLLESNSMDFRIRSCGYWSQILWILWMLGKADVDDELNIGVRYVDDGVWFGKLDTDHVDVVWQVVWTFGRLARPWSHILWQNAEIFDADYKTLAGAAGAAALWFSRQLDAINQLPSDDGEDLSHNLSYWI